MENIIPIKKEINKMSDQELLNNFKKEVPPYGKMNYYPIMAKRIVNFKDTLVEEILSNENNSESIMGIIKVSWIPLISILCYTKEEKEKKRFVTLAKYNWSQINFEDLKSFVKNNTDLNKYF